jgi:hypothetical protein
VSRLTSHLSRQDLLEYLAPSATSVWTRTTKAIMRVLPCALLLMSSVLTAAPEKKEKWQRVYTGEDSIIEIDISKVTFVEYNASRGVTFS